MQLNYPNEETDRGKKSLNNQRHTMFVASIKISPLLLSEEISTITKLLKFCLDLIESSVEISPTYLACMQRKINFKSHSENYSQNFYSLQYGNLKEH